MKDVIFSQQVLACFALHCVGAKQFAGKVYEALRLRLDQPPSCLHTGLLLDKWVGLRKMKQNAQILL